MKNHNLIIAVFMQFLLLLSINTFSQNTIVNSTPPPSQPFNVTATINSHNYTISNGIYKIFACPYDTISISAFGNYTSNDISYHQSDSTTDFVWLHQLNATISNDNFISFNNIALVSRVILYAKDIQNNLSSDSIVIEIAISPKPLYSGINYITDSICLGDSINIMGDATASSYSISNQTTDTNTVYLPDGDGVSYLSTINVNSPYGLSINNGEILSVSAILEHSYTGDLNIEIICPNGQSATLKPQSIFDSNFFGEPIDLNSQQVSGVGYEYIWNMNADSTMIQYFNKFHYSYIDLIGDTFTNHSYLPPSTSYPINSTADSATAIRTYLPEQSFTALNGCPIAGDWTLKITDNMLWDNGYIFSWRINFSNISTLTNNYNQQIINQGWNTDSSITSYIANNINVSPSTIGDNDYTYYAIDSLGCVFDTTITIKTIEIPEVNIGNDTILCANQSLLLDAGSNYYQQWSTQNNNQQELIDSTGIGINTTFIYVTVRNEFGCANFDTINITFTDCSGLNSLNDDDINIDIFPIPSNGDFTIKGEIINQEIISVQIIDINGKEVFKESNIKNSKYINQKIDLSSYSSGTYFIKIKTNKDTFYLKKIIIN